MDACTPTLHQVQALITAAQNAKSIEELRQLLIDNITTFGVDFFLMTHHTDFGRPQPGLVQVSNYPAEFVAMSRQQGDYTDPILKTCEKTLTGFFWDDVPHFLTLSEADHKRAAAVGKYNLGDGFVVPTHIPGEHLGSCHFAVARGKRMPRELAVTLQSIATYTFEAARHLARDSDGPIIEYAPLTDRQRDCLILAARGKSDDVIGQMLSLSPRTVNEHIENAKRRFCVATRQQLIVRALYCSQITFNEILSQPGRIVGWRGDSLASDTIPQVRH